MKTLKGWWVAWLSLLLLAAGCSGGDGGADAEGGGAASVRGLTDGEIVLGTYTDLSGPTAIWGVGATNGARMRFDEVNAAGGVHGRTIRYVVEDMSYQLPKAMQAFNKLVNRDRIFAMLLAVGTPMNNAIMPQQFAAGVPNLFPISGGRQMVEPFHRMKFAQRGIYYNEVRAGVKYFVEQEGKRSICIIHHDSEYGQEIVDATEEQAAALGMEVVARAAHKPTESEFTAAVLRLKQAGCDLVTMATVHRDTILILDTAHKMGWEGVAWVGNNAAYGQVIADCKGCDGYYAFVHMAKIYPEDDKPPPVQAWWDGYMARYDAEPDLAAMEGYRAADLTVMALERAGRELTVDALVAALESIADYRDIFGYRLSFSPENHEGVHESVLSQVREGRFVVLAESVTY